MPELFDAVLNRQPRIALGSVSGSHLGHLFRGVSAEYCRGQDTDKGDDNYETDGTQRPSKDGDSNKKDVTALYKWSRATFSLLTLGVQGELCLRYPFSLESFFSLAVRWRQFLRQRTGISSLRFWFCCLVLLSGKVAFASEFAGRLEPRQPACLTTDGFTGLVPAWTPAHAPAAPATPAHH